MVLTQIALQILRTKAEFGVLLEQIWIEFESSSRKLMLVLQRFALSLWSFAENNIPFKDHLLL